MTLLRRLLGLIALIALVLSLTLFLLVRASLPQLDGSLAVQGLNGTVTIERDQLGVVTIQADQRRDAAFATGFVHGQERFFQMDLQRRVGAGELSALFGAAAVNLDRKNRLHRFRHRAEQIFAAMPVVDAGLYTAYADGVNAGLSALGARPFEYFLLQQKPKPWDEVDILLTVFSMYFELNDEDASRESELGALRELLHDELFDWLIQSGTEWDAPLIGGSVPTVAIPGPEVLDLRLIPAANFGHTGVAEQSVPVRGSNNWAVSAERSADGRAIIAGDMHLGHAVPNIWFRARLIVGAEGLDIVGVTLPGAPFVIAGSNGYVAWALTNSYGDWQDLIELEIDPENADRYKTSGGWREFALVNELIEIKGEQSEQLLIRETIWGPVIDEDFRGRVRAIRWLPHLQEASNAGIARFEQARNIEQAMAAANQTGSPPQNFVVADSRGRIGWTILGRIPVREGYDPAFPSSWVNGAGWQGWVSTENYPQITDPADGVIWTANARTVTDDWLQMLGEGNFAVGARAMQIRDGLRQRKKLAIEDMLEIQLDDRALFLQRWQTLLLGLLTPAATAATPDRAELQKFVASWGGHAAVDSVGYRMVRAFRLDAIARISDALLAEARQQLPDLSVKHHSQLERPIWQLIEQQPLHLLPPMYENWNQYLLAIVDDMLQHFAQAEGGLENRTWGERNTTRIAHPLTYGLPFLSKWLNMPSRPLPGDSNMPRVQAPAFGASQRMAVSPGDEQNGYFHMPGGQSGHPLSSFYRAGYSDWELARPTSFLPGPLLHELMLHPSTQQ